MAGLDRGDSLLKEAVVLWGEKINKQRLGNVL